MATEINIVLTDATIGPQRPGKLLGTVLWLEFCQLSCDQLPLRLQIPSLLTGSHNSPHQISLLCDHDPQPLLDAVGNAGIYALIYLQIMM